MINRIKTLFNKGVSHISNISSTIQKEEVDVLLQDKNQQLQADITRYKENNIKGIKGWENNPKPRMRINGIRREFDKQEPGSVEIGKDNTLKMTLETGGFLQVNNKQIYTDEDKQKELSDLTGKKAVERTEIQDSVKLNLGNEYICKFSFMIPENFPLLANRLVIGQWKQESIHESASQNPFLAQKITRDEGIDYLTFIINNSGDTSGNTSSKKIAKIPLKQFLGKRINMQYEFKLSDKGDSYLKIKLNGDYIKMKFNNEKVETYNGPLLSSSNPEKKKDFKDSIYFKFGLYRDNYDYGIKLLKERHQKELNPNLEKEIAEIEKAKKDEENGNPMTIYFKDYSVEDKNPSTQEESL